VTLERLQAGQSVAYLPPEGLGEFDLVLSYTGGDALTELRARLGARRVAPLYGSVDPAVHRPQAPSEAFRADLSYLGTYAGDRQGILERLFVEPARRAPDRRFLIVGAQYPADFPWQRNTYYIHHLPPAEHPSFYASSRLTLNVTRGAMARMGYCPSGRLFEAAACGAPLLSDHWAGLEHFFRPGEEILIAGSADEALAAMSRTDAELARVSRAARERTLEEHTADHRAEELESLLEPFAQAGPAIGRAPRPRRRNVWGVVPAAGAGTRIQPLAFSKELLPVGSRVDAGMERPRAVSEFLLERMVLGGANRVCFVISPGKSDILEYYGGAYSSGSDGADICYTVQPKPAGLCDALFRAVPLVQPEDDVLIGLPDTVWFPEDGFRRIEDDALAFLCFPVDHPEFFDAVVFEEGEPAAKAEAAGAEPGGGGPTRLRMGQPRGEGGQTRARVREIQVKQPHPDSHWVWGAFRMPGRIFHELHRLWQEPGRRDEYLGTLVNAWLARGGVAYGLRAGETYVDTGTLHGYREAMRALRQDDREQRDRARLTLAQ
jgi:dTDP-glucose pyrophosphorylase